MTLQQADAHQRKHGFKPVGETLCEVFAKEDKPAHGKLRNVKPPKMNRTEREYELLLLAQQRAGEIVEYRFEGIRLVWGGGMVYKPDFFVRHAVPFIPTVIEVKGSQVWDRDIVRFKGCRHEWQAFFDFEFWQREATGLWNRLL